MYYVKYAVSPHKPSSPGIVTIYMKLVVTKMCHAVNIRSMSQQQANEFCSTKTSTATQRIPRKLTTILDIGFVFIGFVFQ